MPKPLSRPGGSRSGSSPTSSPAIAEHPRRRPEATTGRPRLSHIVVLGLLSTFGPLSLDLYLPALPELAAELQTSTSAAQLTITACLLGLAIGQLVAGPLSDRLGRRRPLIVGLIVYLLASAACAVAPTIWILVALRLLQGLAGAAGLVIARAVARDLYAGRSLVVFFSRLMLISGLAPVLAPVIGGQLSRVMSWRGIFLVLAGFGVVLLIAGAFGLRETLPVDRRQSGGWRQTRDGFAVLVRDRIFLGSALSAGLAGASMFAYIAGSTFVLQRIYQLSAQGFSLAFAVNSVGIMVAGQVSSRLARRWPTVRILGLGLALNLIGAAALAASVLGGLGLSFILGSLLVMVAPLGLIFPTATALAMSDYPDQAGAASSLLGVSQFIAGAVAAPLVGVAGEDSAVPLGVVALTASVCASGVYAVLVVPAARRLRQREAQPVDYSPSA